MIGPVVISYSSETPRHDARFARELRGLAAGAAAAAADVGIDLRWVNAAAADAAADAVTAGAAGVIVLGGADVDPALYGQAPAGAHVRSMDAAADMFECELMRRALDAGRPLLTICRGMQLLNVVLGGTLVQDLGEGIHVRDDVPMISHPVHVHPGTRLAGIVGAGAHDIRSGHHQAVDRLGAGLAVSATAPDGVIEAVELPGAWVVGVQWHPEDAGADPAPFRSLLADFARAAADAPRSGPAQRTPA